MTDWVSIYNKNKKNNLHEYTTLISNIISIDNKKLIGNKKRTSDILESAVNVYVKKHFYNNNSQTMQPQLFIENKLIKQYNINNEVDCVIKYYIKNNIIMDIKNNENEIILLAIYIKIASRIEKMVNPFLSQPKNINNTIIEIINEYNKVDFIYLIDQGKTNTRALINKVKKNIDKEKKFFEIFSSDSSFNKYIRINEDYEAYIVQYNYYINNLEKFDPKPIKKVYEESGSGDKFTLISTELAFITLLKEYSIQKQLSTFLIPVKIEFFKKDKNIKELKELFELEVIKKQIKLLINYNDLNPNLLVKLKRNSIKYYIYCNKNATITDFEETEQYVFSKEFIKKHQMEDKKNVILETINVYMQDNDILSLKSKEIAK